MNRILYLVSLIPRAILPEKLFCKLGHHEWLYCQGEAGCLLCGSERKMTAKEIKEFDSKVAVKTIKENGR